MTDLSILCVSRFGEHAEPFIRHLADAAVQLGARFVLAADGETPRWAIGIAHGTVRVKSSGYLESVLDTAVAACPDGYVLRMDDDERISPSLSHWLAQCKYRDADHWAFPRMHLWPDETRYITNAPLWPDLQTRLSVKAKAGGRPRIHQGSPHGTGRVAEDAVIEHHKFLVRDRQERERLLAHYESLQPGTGSGHYAAFSVPERFAHRIQTARVA